MLSYKFLEEFLKWFWHENWHEIAKYGVDWICIPSKKNTELIELIEFKVIRRKKTHKQSLMTESSWHSHTSYFYAFIYLSVSLLVCAYIFRYTHYSILYYKLYLEMFWRNQIYLFHFQFNLLNTNIHIRVKRDCVYIKYNFRDEFRIISMEEGFM